MASSLPTCMLAACSVRPFLSHSSFRPLAKVAVLNAGEDALANLSIEKQDGVLQGHIRIRSKTQGIALSLGDKCVPYVSSLTLGNSTHVNCFHYLFVQGQLGAKSYSTASFRLDCRPCSRIFVVPLIHETTGFDMRGSGVVCDCFAQWKRFQASLSCLLHWYTTSVLQCSEYALDVDMTICYSDSIKSNYLRPVYTSIRVAYITPCHRILCCQNFPCPVIQPSDPLLILSSPESPPIFPYPLHPQSPDNGKQSIQQTQWRNEPRQKPNGCHDLLLHLLYHVCHLPFQLWHLS